MKNSTAQNVRYRIWITLQRGASGSADASSCPAVLLEPAEEGTMSPHRAARYVAAFNHVAAAHGRPVRAVALRVAVRYEGEPSPGELLDATASGHSDSPTVGADRVQDGTAGPQAIGKLTGR